MCDGARGCVVVVMVFVETTIFLGGDRRSWNEGQSVDGGETRGKCGEATMTKRRKH